ncbi:TlpA disulfide reductase family protein, partial [Acinetobacter baumannii]
MDNLQAALGGTDFEVIALSVDRGGVEPIRRFFGETGVKRLPIFVDLSGKALRDLGALGLPTTILLDREGREVGRLVGPAAWDSPEMA